MARRYTRDNRGRFASVGATARGGRLATASGNKRATQTKSIGGGNLSGTIGKNRKAKNSINPKQQRQLELERINLRRRADATSARMGYTNATAADQARLASSARSDRERIARIDAQLKGTNPLPIVLAQGRPLTGEKMGNYRGGGRFSLYGKDRGVIARDRLPSTVRKPSGLKPGALTPKPPAPSKPLGKSVQSKAEKAVKAAQKRLKNKQYGYTANQAQALAIDRRVARMTPQQFAAGQVRSSSALVRRTQRALRDPINANAPASWRQRMNNILQQQKSEYRAAASDYRILKPRRKRQ